MKTVNFAVFLHNHQPVGNFDKVFVRACDTCYLRLIDVLADYPEVRLTMHFSGSLLEWIETNRPEIADRIAAMVRSGQIELMGGGYYEPILTMLTEEDRQGQIRRFSDHLAKRYGASVRGAWLTERVWEQSLTATLADAGIEYTALDDSHFHAAGISADALNGSYLTEDEGRTLRIFPGSEYLRYVIPFHDPEKTIEYLGRYATEQGGDVVTYADDGEKFGIWPKTEKHVYEDGWLRRWLDALRANREWIRFVTGSEAIGRFAPRGKVYLPDASYREMMEWSLPAATLEQLEDLTVELKRLGLDRSAKPFLKGGTWRNFRVKYPELAVMYAKMMRTSAKVNAMKGPAKRAALLNLYRGQCNCAWWHGVFGGLYLPHLRRGVKAPLIMAEAAADKAAHKPETWLDVESGDFDFDGRPEVSLANADARATFKPSLGGHLIEYSVPALGLDFADTLARRKEAYHRKVFVAAEQPAGEVKSIHDISVLKEKGLEKLLQYDWFPRRSFMDHFFGPETDIHAFARSDYREVGDFTLEPWAATARRDSRQATLVLRREGGVCPAHERIAVVVQKTATLARTGTALSMAYVISAPDRRLSGLRLGVQINLALVTGGEMGCYYRCGATEAGDPAQPAVLPDAAAIEFIDEPGGYAVSLTISPPGELWVFPVQTVSQSESGFERVFQSAAVVVVRPLDLDPGAAGCLDISCAARRLC